MLVNTCHDSIFFSSDELEAKKNGKSPFEVVWTGKYPCLCHGEWIITKDGRKVQLPNDVKNIPMNTHGTFERIYWQDESPDWYEDGLSFDEWFKENSWAQDICDTIEERVKLYAQIQESDWRHHSCGGCV